LQHYDVIQPWSDAYDLGPHDEHIAHHRSFCRQYFHRQPMVPTTRPYRHGDGGPNRYPPFRLRLGHDTPGVRPGRRAVRTGRHGIRRPPHVAGSDRRGNASVPSGVSDAHRREVERWEGRALRHINRDIGYVSGTIEHLFHGRKADRGYQSRWDMFVKHDFDPLEDMKRNSHGVPEFASNKPELRHDFGLYLQNRNEDINSL